MTEICERCGQPVPPERTEDERTAVELRRAANDARMEGKTATAVEARRAVNGRT